MTRIRAAVSAVLIATLGATGCTAGSSGSDRHAASSRTAPVQVTGGRTLTGAERSFGAGVGSIPGAVYRSDVVVIGGGASAIVDALDNGLVWTIRGDAPGASRLEVGKVMVATSLATGRVAQVGRASGNVQVLLTPVSLTDVFEELHVDSSTPVTLAQPLVYSYENSPLASSDTDSGAAAEPATTTPQAPPTAPSPPRFFDASRVGAPLSDPTLPTVPTGVPRIALPEPAVTPKAVHRGKFDLTPYCCYPSQGVRIAYHEPAGRMAATVGIVMGSKPLVDFHIDIDSGGLQEAVFELNGPKAIEFQFEAATTDVSGNYRSPTLALPLAFTFPIAGVPFTVSLTQTVRASIELLGGAAFSSQGQYKISGGLGFAYRHGKFGATTPTFTTEISALQNAASLAVGVNALSIGYGAHFSVGIGVVGFNGGLNFDLDGTLAIAKDGSPPTSSLTAGCTTAAVGVTGSYGVGYTIPRFVTNAVNAFLRLFGAKPVRASSGKRWGPYSLWSPGLSKRCLHR